ncbi:MAG: hypothetical protein ACE5Z5_12985 [Candidatus Bathyarchaeia archaeon]
MKITLLHPDQVGAARAPQVGQWVSFQITVENDEDVTHRNTRVHFNPVGPTSEMWFIKEWKPRVVAQPIPGQGLLFDVGDLAPRQTFMLTIKSVAPAITRTKKYPIEIEFESASRPREVLQKGEITVVAR